MQSVKSGVKLWTGSTSGTHTEHDFSSWCTDNHNRGVENRTAFLHYMKKNGYKFVQPFDPSVPLIDLASSGSFERPTQTTRFVMFF